jgi:hypothetical protein
LDTPVTGVGEARMIWKGAREQKAEKRASNRPRINPNAEALRREK